CACPDASRLKECSLNRKKGTTMRTFEKLKCGLAVLAMFAVLVVVQPSLSAAPSPQDAKHNHSEMNVFAPATLVQKVRQATQQFLDVNNAVAAQYGPFLGCVSGPDHGAMGIHYVNSTLVGDGRIDSSKPEALIY